MTLDIFITGFSEFSTCRAAAAQGIGKQADASMISSFKFDSDVSSLFPYINAVCEDAVYYEKPLFIKFMHDGCLCGLHPDKGAVASFSSSAEAYAFTHRLIDFMNDIYRRRREIRPSFKTLRPVNVLDILRILPRTNCRECGYKTCMAFAAALSIQEAAPNRCPYLGRPISESAEYAVYDAHGNLRSTVTIDIDTSKTMHDLDAKQKQIEALEKKLSTISDNKTVENGNDLLPAPLTERELEVLRLMAHGATNKEISDLLGISPHTSKSHVIHIFNKLGVNDRTQAAVWATRHNLV